QDTTPPVVTVPADRTAEATGPSGAAVTFTTSAEDLVDGATSVSCTPASGSTFALGTATVTCTSTDAHGNTATGTFEVTVRDTTPPELSSIPDDIIAEASGPEGATISYVDPIATDIVDGADTVSCAPPSGSRFALDAATVVTCTA